MQEIPFTYFSIYWTVPAAIIGAMIGAALGRNIIPTLFMSFICGMGVWIAHDQMLHSSMEQWLAGQRAYAILFKDFPKDKEHYITEHVTAYKIGGDVALKQKHEEMKIIMLLHHIPHYIEHAHTDTVQRYILAQAWLFSSLSKKDHNLCNHYVADSKWFANVWTATGSDIFLASIRYFPQMIIEATDSPEEVGINDRTKAMELTGKMLEAMSASGVLKTMRTNGLCDAEYQQYYLMSQMPPKDGALVAKFILGEGHLKATPGKSVFEKLLPF